MSPATTSRCVIVPMHVEALVVASAIAAPPARWQWTSLAIQTLLFKHYGIGSVARFDPNPFTGRSLEPGVHLHWAMPSALTHGLAGAHGTVFPHLPDRWLITCADAATTRSWLLESTRVDGVDKKRVATRIIASGERVKVELEDIGRAWNLNDLAGGSAGAAARYSQIPLTAVAPGDPAFAAFYPSCRNVFGFLDHGAPKQGKCTYSICGWYADPKDDPLHADTESSNSAGAVDWKAEVRRRWVLPTGALPAAADRTLLHGAVCNVDPNNAQAFPGLPNTPRVAAGATAIEALAAHIGAKREATDSDADPVLQAILYGMLNDGGALQDVATIERELRQRRFTPVGQGRVWEVRPRTTQDLQAAASGVRALSDRASGQHAQLNRSQAALDGMRQRLERAQWDYYRGWWATRNSGQPSAWDGEGADRARVEQCRAAVTEHEHEVSDLRQRLEPLLDAEGHELIEGQAPAFWQANAPVLLTSWYQAKLGTKYARNAALSCRQPGQLVAQLVVVRSDGHYRLRHDSRAGGDPYPLSNLMEDDEWPWPAPQGLPPACPSGEIQALFRETLLFHADVAKRLAKRIVELQRDTSAGMLEDDMCEQLSLPVSFDTQPWAIVDAGSEDAPLASFPPATALREWNASEWSPLFMAWRVAISADNLPEQRTFEGWAPLDDSATALLQSVLGQYGVEGVPAERLGPFLGQAMGGLHRSLLGMIEAPRLPPLDAAGYIDERVHDLIGGTPSCVPGEAAPIGHLVNAKLHIQRVWFSDAFGRTRKAIDHEDGNAEVHALGDRILYPARLRFEWIAADGSPSTNPVCGFLIYSEAERALLVFDADGRIQGQLQRVVSPLGKALRWCGYTIEKREDAAATPAAGAARPRLTVVWRSQTEHPDPAIELADGHLQRLLRAIKDAGPEALEQLARAMRARLDATTTHASAGEALAALAGGPIAVARARLQLEALDEMELDRTAQAWKDLCAKDYDVSLGNYASHSDGLVGYFRDSNAETYQRLTAATGDNGSGDGYVALPQSLALSFTATAATSVTLLVDPRAAVSATTTVLPTATLALPHARLAEALRRMDMVFRIGPCIAKTGRFRVPVGSPNDGAWVWGRFERVAGRLQWHGQSADDDAVAESPLEPGALELYEGWLGVSETLGGGSDSA